MAERGYRAAPGTAVQVDPIKSTLKAPGTKRLQLKSDEPLSSIAFKLNSRRYNLALACEEGDVSHVPMVGRCNSKSLQPVLNVRGFSSSYLYGVGFEFCFQSQPAAPSHHGTVVQAHPQGEPGVAVLGLCA